MKKEWLLFIITGIITVTIALLLIRWLAPGLLGIPVDLQLVQVEKKIPPFFDNIFRLEEQASGRFMLQDPHTKTRPQTFVPKAGSKGPHDLLGFRNNTVPNVSDIVIIGDSQSYGLNVPLEFNWPGQVRKELSEKQVSVYNMSVGGWGAVQYAYIFKYTHLFQPRIVIVAFYTGNDPLESFALAYGSELWKDFRPDPALTKADAPPINFPAPPEEKWPVTFSDGISTVFTPDLRLSSNLDHPAVQAGYEIMARAAEKITFEAGQKNIRVFFTIIPTKELVYADKVRKEQITAPAKYKQLVTNETQNIVWLKERLSQLEGAQYIDVVKPLQKQAMLPSLLYPEFANGHPLYDGYSLIGRIIARQIAKFIPDPPAGFIHSDFFTPGERRLFYAQERKFWVVPPDGVAEAWGWKKEVKYPAVNRRDLAVYEFMGVLQ